MYIIPCKEQKKGSGAMTRAAGVRQDEGRGEVRGKREGESEEDILRQILYYTINYYLCSMRMINEKVRKRFARAKDGGRRRQSKIQALMLPSDTKKKLTCLKELYEDVLGERLSYEQLLLWMMDNVGLVSELDSRVRRLRLLREKGYLNDLSSKEAIVSYLNSVGAFWEYCNGATALLSDEEVIMKALLNVEFEDMPQVFGVFGKHRCEEVWRRSIRGRDDYYGVISFLLGALFFND